MDGELGLTGTHPLVQNHATKLRVLKLLLLVLTRRWIVKQFVKHFPSAGLRDRSAEEAFAQGWVRIFLSELFD